MKGFPKLHVYRRFGQYPEASLTFAVFFPLLGVVTGAEYRYALSNSCLVFFLIELALSVIVTMDAYRRGLPGIMWGFIAFVLPYIGVPIYLIYIVAGGYTRFHVKRDPAAEEIKRKWQDEGEPVKEGPPLTESEDKNANLSPYMKR